MCIRDRDESLGDLDNEDLVQMVSDLRDEKRERKKKKKAIVRTAEPLNCSDSQFCLLLEKLLLFYAWYKGGVMPGWNDEILFTSFDISLRLMLLELKTYVPRKQGDGWGTQKFHFMFHTMTEIRGLGSPVNWDTGPEERGLRDWAKQPATLVQKRGIGLFLSLIHI